jgi:hypothetical protein
MQPFSAGGWRFEFFRESGSGLIQTFICLDEQGFRLERYSDDTWIARKSRDVTVEGAWRTRYR